MSPICLYVGREVRISQGHENREAQGQVGRVTAVNWANHGKEYNGKWRDVWVHLVTLANGREIMCTDGQLSRV